MSFKPFDSSRPYFQPTRATKQSACYDLYAAKVSSLPLHVPTLVHTNVALDNPDPDCAYLVCSRSGLALKAGIIVLNAPGVVDADYPGEIGVILMNMKGDRYLVKQGDKIAQLLIVKYLTTNTESAVDTIRAGGFGSTGK